MDQKFWKWFVDKIVKGWSTSIGHYKYIGPMMVSLRITPKEGLYGKNFSILFDPTKPDSKVFIDFHSNTTAQTTKIGQRLMENFKDLTFKDFEPLIASEPFNLDFSDTKENLSSSNVSKIMRGLNKKFGDKEVDHNLSWSIIKYLKDILGFNDFESNKMSTLFINLKKQGVDMTTAISDFESYQSTGTYRVSYVKPFIVYVKFQEDFDAQNETQARNAYLNAVENKELDERDITKNRVLSQNMIHSIINYNPFVSVSNKRQVINIEKID